jgi:hypothetical protein
VCPITDRRRTCRGPVQRPLIKMADNSGSACMEQRVVMTFLVNEGVKPADIYRRLERPSYVQKCILVVVYRTSYSCRILIILEFSRHFFEK